MSKKKYCVFSVWICLAVKLLPHKCFYDLFLLGWRALGLLSHAVTLQQFGGIGISPCRCAPVHSSLWRDHWIRFTYKVTGFNVWLLLSHCNMSLGVSCRLYLVWSFPEDHVANCGMTSCPNTDLSAPGTAQWPGLRSQIEQKAQRSVSKKEKIPRLNRTLHCKSDVYFGNRKTRYM